MKLKQNLVILCSILMLNSYSQFISSETQNIKNLIQNLLIGENVKIFNIDYKGTKESIGYFSCNNCDFEIKKGLILSTGTIHIKGPNKEESFSVFGDGLGDEMLETISKKNTYDASYISFVFYPKHNYISFKYIFGSEEYEEYVGSLFNDVFAFILTDLVTKEQKNLAVLPGTNIPISINTINHKLFNEFYKKNKLNPNSKNNTIKLDGYTKELVAFSKVKPNHPYNIKIVIADVGDRVYDSDVLIKAKSFKSQTRNDFINENKDYILYFDRNIKKNKKKLERIMNINNQESNKLIIYFNTDIYSLKDSDYKKIDSFLLQNKTEKKCYYIIYGHTDNIGGEEYNIELSNNRALSIKQVLIDRNINSKLIRIKAFDYKKPIDSNQIKEGRAKNRRVEIIIKCIE